MKVSLLGVGLLALTSTFGFAQAAPAAPAVQRHAATINQRRDVQQHRIAQGIRSGQISARKGAKLEHREARIARTEHRMRRADGGRLTRTDRVRLNHRLNHTSRAISHARNNRMKQ